MTYDKTSTANKLHGMEAAFLKANSISFYAFERENNEK